MKKLISILLSLAVIIGVVPMTVSAVTATKTSISTQPTNFTGNIGDTATFSVTLKNGTGAKYQWQTSTNSGKTWTNISVTGAKTAKAKVTVTAARLKNLYRCKITPKTGSVIYSKSVKMVLSPLKISKQPVNFTGLSGATATFSVTVKNSKGVTYQWQNSTDSGKTWTNASITGAKTAKTSVKITTSSLKKLYRCKLKDAAGKVYYSVSVKPVLDKIAVSKQPSDFIGTIGNTAKFTFTVKNGTDAKYQWQYSADNGKTWANAGITGNKTTTASIAVSSARLKYLYRCRITSKYGSVIYTNSVKMQLDKLAIATQPVDYTGVVGSKATFRVTVSDGEGATYKWQYSKDGGATWTDSTMSGSTTAKASVTATEARESCLYRCKITSAYGKVIYTDAVKMILDKLVISVQPADVHGKIGDTASFSIELANGEAQSYQWQQSADGGDNWDDCTISGFDTASVNAIITEARANNLYRCKITTSFGRVLYSDSVRMIPDLLAVSKQPVSFGGETGESAVFSVETENGEVGSYKWQYSSDKGRTWNDCEDADSASLTVVLCDENDKNIYRCKITSAYGKVIFSDDVKAVQDKLEISGQPKNYTAIIGKTATFTVETANGEVQSYQWQYSADNGKNWNVCGEQGSNTASLAVTVSEAVETVLYRCQITSIYGKVINSVPAAVIVDRLSISAQPSDFHGAPGVTATLTVETANGEAQSYLWQQSSDGGDNWQDCTAEGYNTKTLSETVSEGKALNIYRCKITSASDNVLYTVSVKIIPDLLTVSVQPADVAGVVGSMADFTVETENGTVAGYCWQESSDNGQSWNNCTLEGADTKTISVEITDENAEKLYRCQITSTYNKVINSYKVKVIPDKLEISVQPADYTGLMGSMGVFSVETANGTEETYCWQSSGDKGTTWEDCNTEGSDTAALNITISQESEAKLYRCKVTSRYGKVLYTDSVRLISDKLSIVTQPENVYGEVGTSVSFTVQTGNGEVESYLWQESEDDGANWVDCTLEGKDTATVNGSVSVEGGRKLYRCVITSKYGKVLYTESVKMIPDLLQISEQPVSVTTLVGSTVYFRVKTQNGEIGSIRWQASSDNGKNWDDCYVSGAETATVSFTASEATSKLLFRCKITSFYGKVLYSDEVRINLDALCISKQPDNISGYSDDVVDVSVETADGTVESYQWQYSSDNGENWIDIAGEISATAGLTVNEENAKKLYRCHIVSIYGKVIDTVSVSMTVLCRHTNVITDEAIPATCTTDGKTEGSHCADCNAVLTAQEVICALGHNMIPVDALTPGCLDGHTAYSYCDREGCDYKEGYEVIPATGEHSYIPESVTASGVTRGYNLHTCSMCGDTYKTGPYDFSLYQGMTFSASNKFLIPYNFNSSVYTIEASVNVPESLEGAAGVIVGNYNGLDSCFNLEIAEGGLVKLYFKIVGDTEDAVYCYTFTRDIRSNGVVNLAVTIEKGLSALYVDGEFVESVTLDGFEIPMPKRAFVLGGDCRTGNVQAFKGTLYSVAIFRDIRTQEEICNDIVLADVNDADYCVGYNIIDENSLTGGASVNNPFENVSVNTAEDLEYYASIGTKNIEISGNIVLDRTVYVMGDVCIYSVGDYSITRAPGFAGDMFVVGTNRVNRNLILDSIECRLTLGKAETGTLTVDGNKQNTTVAVHGTLVYVINSGHLTVNEGAVLTNNKKVANSRTLAIQQSYRSYVGGAAIININGAVVINGGVISDNEVNINCPADEDTTATDYHLSVLGGAIFNASDLTVNGGVFSGNSGYYGGAIANQLNCRIKKGRFINNYSSHAGGAVYTSNSHEAKTVLGTQDGKADDLIFENNSTLTSGGAVYSGTECSVLIYGYVTFKGNSAKSTGGAISAAGYNEITGPVEITGNTAATGGAIYVTYKEAENVSRRQCSYSKLTLKNNSASNGGAFAICGALVSVSDSTFTDNTSEYKGGAFYIVNTASGTGADVTLDGITMTGNSGAEAGAVFGDRNCVINISDSHINGNSTTSGNGGAISLHGSILTIDGCELDSNTSADSAGAVYISYRTVTAAAEQSEGEEQTQETTETYYDSTVVIKNSTISNNTATNTGGAICGYNKNKESNILTCENVTFTKNTAGANGGAVFSSGNASLTECTFTENSAGNGGAVNLTSQSNTVDGCNFSGNTAKTDGGAMYLKGSATVRNCEFSKNTSGANGGAISVYNAGNTLTVNGNTFNENVSTGNGGAIYVNKSVATGSDNTFTANTGSMTSYGGGAIYTTGGTVSLSGTQFSGNKAYYGGAIAGYSQATITLTDTVATGNTAVSGGFAFAKNTTLTVNNSETGTTTVSANTSSSGGSAVYADVGSVITVDGATVKDNVSTGSGGAFYAYSGNTSMTVRNCTITGNVGKYGCVLLAYGGKASFIGCTISCHNATSGMGGAFYLRENSDSTAFADVTAESCTFSANSSTGTSGGAVYVKPGSSFTANACQFSQNTADADGGAIYSAGTANITGCTFTGNSALNGGAVKIENSSATVTDTAFNENSATGSDGGAIYAIGTTETRCTLTLKGVNCNGNTSVTNGGAYYLKYCDATLDSGEYTANTSKLGGVFYVNRATLGLVEADDSELIFGTEDSANATDKANTATNGGVIYATVDAVVTIDGATFGYNKATSNGGAIDGSHASGAVISVTNSDFIGNSAKLGGAIYGELASDTDVSTTTFTSNTATSGGAVYVKDTADFDAVNSTFTSNTANDGGAVYIYTKDTNTVSFTGCTFDSNSAAGNTGSSLSRGGAVYSSMGSKTEYTDVTLKNNTSTGNGAGICATYASDNNVKLTPNIIINSLTIDMAAGVPVYIASAQVHGTVTSSGVVDANNPGAAVKSNLVSGTLTNITFN